MLAKMTIDFDDLDCLIETHVFGQTTVGKPYLFEGIRYVKRCIDGEEHHMPLRSYSQNIADAWGLVCDFKLWYAYSKKKLNRQHMEWSMANDLSEGEVVSFILIVQDGFERKIYAAEGTTLERAICFAVLRAKGVEVQDDIMEG